jgi:hypothetical protein
MAARTFCWDTVLEMAEEGDTVYGSSFVRLGRFVMAGGSADAWNYVVHFDEHGEQTAVFVERVNGQLEKQDIPPSHALCFAEHDGDKLKLCEPNDEWTSIMMPN